MKKLFRIKIAAMLILMIVFSIQPHPIQAQTDDLGRLNRELDPLNGLVKRASSIGGNLVCSDANCDKAVRLSHELAQLEMDLRAYRVSILNGKRDSLSHLENLIRTSTITAAKKARLEKGLAYQSFLMDFGSMLLDVASVMDFFKSIKDIDEHQLEVLRAGRPGSGPNVAQHLFRAEFWAASLGSLNDARSLIGTLNRLKTADGPNDPAMAAFLDTVNVDALTTQIDAAIAGIRAAEAKLTGNPAHFLTSARSLGQVAGFLALEIAKIQRAEMVRQIEEEERNLAAEMQPHATTFEEWGKYSRLRDKIEEVLATVALARQSVYVAARSCNAPDFRPEVRFRYTGTGELRRYYANTIIPGHTRVLGQLMASFAGSSGSRSEPLALVLRSPLSVEESDFPPSVRAGETVTAVFTVPRCLVNTAWVGMMSTNERHQNKAPTSTGILSSLSLRGRDAGSLSFKAPAKAGIYDLRLFTSTNNGREVAWTAFRVSTRDTTGMLINGGFEAGPDPGSFIKLRAGSREIPGWLVTKGMIDYVGSALNCPGGRRCVDLDGTPGPGAISQTFSTVAGGQYRLEFMLSGNSACDRGIKTLSVRVAGQGTTYTVDTSKPQAAVPHNLSFTAKTASTTLEFQSLDPVGNCGPVIDNVRVTR